MIRSSAPAHILETLLQNPLAENPFLRGWIAKP